MPPLLLTPARDTRHSTSSAGNLLHRAFRFMSSSFNNLSFQDFFDSPPSLEAVVESRLPDSRLFGPVLHTHRPTAKRQNSSSLPSEIKPGMVRTASIGQFSFLSLRLSIALRTSSRCTGTSLGASIPIFTLSPLTSKTMT